MRASWEVIKFMRVENFPIWGGLIKLKIIGSCSIVGFKPIEVTLKGWICKIYGVPKSRSCCKFLTMTKEVGTHLLFLQICAFGSLYWIVLVVPFAVVIKAFV